MIKYLFASLLFTILAINISYGQPLRNPKTIRSNGDYAHEATGTILPAQIGAYERYKLSAWDKQHENVCAEYKLETQTGDTKMSVFIYPAGNADDMRLRGEFRVCEEALALRAGHNLEVNQGLCMYKKDGYRINGFKAFYIENGLAEELEVYECGEWFFKIRVTSGVFDSGGIYSLTKQAIDQINPTCLVKHSNLSLKTTIGLNPETESDKGLMYCAVANSLKKIVWTQDHIDSLEKAAGFPDLYLEEYVDVLSYLVDKTDSVKDASKTSYYVNYVGQLKLLKNAGYLDEFVMLDFNSLLFPPENHVFDFKGYFEWKKTHRITINLRTRYFYIQYLTKEEAAKEKKE